MKFFMVVSSSWCELMCIDYGMCCAVKLYEL